MTTQWERMKSGELYVDDDPRLFEARCRADELAQRYNATAKAETETRREILDELLGSAGEDVDIVGPLRCDYGDNIHIGARSFFNFDIIFLDVAEIKIGEDVAVGPKVQFLTPFHPLSPKQRREHWEGAKPITVGDNVWIGAGAIICAGVTIGDNCVIGANSVVTRDIPANTLAMGTPARPTKTLEDDES